MTIRARLTATVCHPLFKPVVFVLACIVAALFHPAGVMLAPLAIGAVLEEGRYPGEFLLTELPGKLSRDTVTVTVGAESVFEPGTVLGKITATGKYVAYDDANSDGSEVAAGILLYEARNDDDAPADKDAVVVNYGAEVRADDLVWGDGVDEAGGTADLRTLAIKARE